VVSENEKLEWYGRILQYGTRSDSDGMLDTGFMKVEATRRTLLSRTSDPVAIAPVL
jgi:hypothetical protein